MIRRADKEHTAVVFITGNRSAIHGKGRAGLIVGALFTDLHAAGDRAAVQFQFAAIDEHFALNLPLSEQSVSVSVAPLPTVILPLIVCPFRQRLTSPSVGTVQFSDTDSSDNSCPQYWAGHQLPSMLLCRCYGYDR